MPDFPQIIKKLAVTPVVEGVSPWAKSAAIVDDVRNLSEYITVPTYASTQPNPYVRQLLFQFNASLDHDFFLLNVENYRAYVNMIVSGGCLCVKYRVGEDVFRYKLFDSDDSTDWSFFEAYSNQIIKANFCLEFWSNDLQVGEYMHGIVQPLILKTSKIVSRANISDTDTYTDISAPPFTIADLAGTSATGMYIAFSGAMAQLGDIVQIYIIDGFKADQSFATTLADLMIALATELTSNGYSSFAVDDNLGIINPDGVVLERDVNVFFFINGLIAIDSIGPFPPNLEILPQTQDNLVWLDNV